MLRLFVVAALYIVVLQAILSYTVPSARDAGLSEFWPRFAYFAVNVAAMVARLAWGSVADRQAARGAYARWSRWDRRRRRRARLRVRAARRAGPRGPGRRAVRLRGAGLERARVRRAPASGPLRSWRGAPSRLPRPWSSSSRLSARRLLGALVDHAGWDAFWITTRCCRRRCGAYLAAPASAAAVEGASRLQSPHCILYGRRRGEDPRGPARRSSGTRALPPRS